MGKYIYCIIRCAEPRRFTHRGIGERGDVVHTVNFGDLAAVVSDSPVVEYERARRHLLAHTVVLEEVMEDFTLLPVRFGTVAPSADAVKNQLLKRRYDELSALVTEMLGRVELGLKAVWYEDAIFREIVEENTSVRQLRDRLVGLPAEETHFERMRLGEMVETPMGAKRDADARRILTRLSPLAERTRENALFTDRMVLNAAFLVRHERGAQFDRAIDELDAEMGGRMVLKYVGPTPPYNFVNITVVWDRPQELGEVRPREPGVPLGWRRQEATYGAE